MLFKIEPKKHREAFNGISQYLFEKYGLSADPNGVSLSKPYIVDFDPFIYINPLYSEVPVFTDYVKEVQIKEIVGFVYSPNDFDSIIKQIVARRVNICEGYSEWIKVGFAISEQFGASGSHYFHEVSKISSI
ncbi:MAG: PriCT-2 domain-containing protein [Chitinophagaceae bacterium]|nr:PriCT-2 domain-containing protein [Chitinophagaceae bacterium]